MGKLSVIVRVALIGCGGISGAHANGVSKHQDKIKYTVLCDIVPEKMLARSTQLGGVDHHFADWKKMFQEAEGEFDAVDNAKGW